MITRLEVNETNNMIEHENLDVRTITLGISLLDCCDSDLDKLNEKIYNKITTLAKDLVPTGKQIERDFGIPIVNKRISVTPIALVGGYNRRRSIRRLRDAVQRTRLCCVVQSLSGVHEESKHQPLNDS